MKIGLVTPLPPAPSGAADYAAGLLSAFSERCDLTCFVDERDVIAPDLADRFAIAPLSEYAKADVDLMVYAVANNPAHMAAIDAALQGPAGVVVVHDASLHHLLAAELLDEGRVEEYRAIVQAAHGDAVGRALDRWCEEGVWQTELFLFDLLSPIVRRHRGVIVHNEYSRRLLSRRCPGARIWVVPHYAIAARPTNDAPIPAALPDAGFVICHLGFVTPAKRPLLLLDAFARLLSMGIDAHLVFAGEDRTWGSLRHRIDTGGLTERVTVTGFLREEELDTYAAAADAVVSLRWPHVGESSGTLMRTLREGTAAVVQELGPWAELPNDAVVRVAATGDEAQALAEAFRSLATDPALRSRVSADARSYARRVGGPVESVERQLSIWRGLMTDRDGSPQQVSSARTVAVDQFLAGGTTRLREALLGSGSVFAHEAVDEHLQRYHVSLRSLPPAHRGARLLDVGSFPFVLRIFASVWGYEVSACGHGVAGQTRIEVPPGVGLPSFDAIYDSVDVERDTFPYDTGSMDVVTCWEVIEHLTADPMHMLCEINRVLRPDGLLILSTPNVVSLRSVRAVLAGYHPFLWSQFIRSGSVDRHNREYTALEIRQLLAAAGFSDHEVRTEMVWEEHDAHTEDALRAAGGTLADRGDLILACVRKVSLPRDRYPAQFYR